MMEKQILFICLLAGTCLIAWMWLGGGASLFRCRKKDKSDAPGMEDNEYTGPLLETGETPEKKPANFTEVVNECISEAKTSAAVHAAYDLIEGRKEENLTRIGIDEFRYMFILWGKSTFPYLLCSGTCLTECNTCLRIMNIILMDKRHYDDETETDRLFENLHAECADNYISRARNAFLLADHYIINRFYSILAGKMADYMHENSLCDESMFMPLIYVKPDIETETDRKAENPKQERTIADFFDEDIFKDTIDLYNANEEKYEKAIDDSRKLLWKCRRSRHESAIQDIRSIIKDMDEQYGTKPDDRTDKKEVL